MSIVTMSMSDYEIERDDSMVARVCPADKAHSSGTPYGDEVLYAGWNPSLALQLQTETKQAAAMPRELATTDVASFLDKMYAYQR